MTIRTQTPPNSIGRPSVSFDSEAFSAAIFDKGYNVILEESRQCPCRSKSSGSPLPTCQNCYGLGWVFLNPIHSKAIVSGIKKTPKYSEWSEESVGTISATLMNENKLTEYDRITFVDVVSKRSESLVVRTIDGRLFVFLTYKPQSILDIFFFESPSLPLTKLTEEEYSISSPNSYIIELNFGTSSAFNNTVTVTYLHYDQYIVIDLPHNLRASSIVNSQGQIEKVDLPINAILRKTAIVFGRNDYGSLEIIDNTYK